MIQCRKLIRMLDLKNKRQIPLYLFLLFYLGILIIYLKQDTIHKLEKPSTYVITMVWLLFTLLTLLKTDKVKSFFQKHALWFRGALLILSPAASFLVVELMVSNYNWDMFKSYSYYNLIWYMVIYYLVFVLTRSSKLTVILCNLAIYLAAMINYFVYIFRGNPILPSDLLAWQTGMSVAANYEISFTEGFLIATLIMFLVFCFAYVLEGPKKKPSLINRFALIGSYVVFYVIVYHTYFGTDFITTKIRVLDFFAPKYTYCSYGTAFGFVANMEAMNAKAPEGYSALKAAETLDKVKLSDDTLSKADKPNIIVIMNEAFSDLSLLGDFQTNMDYLPFIHSMKENTTKGTLYVSVFGGATSDTEYEFLTGNSMAVMPQNSVPYQQFVTEPRDSLAKTLKSQGYYNIAIHPYEPTGYKRDLVYPLLGFDEFLSMKDFKNPTLIRSFISDQDSYQKIIEQYEAKGKKQPVFIFNVTMQNHGGYSDAQLFSDSETVRLTQDTGYKSAEQYLSLLRKSDEAYQKLIDYFSKQKEHTIILLYGDHQPIAYSGLHDLLLKKEALSETEALRRKYRVPFILWANYDIPEESIDEMSANYLSSYLLKTAGLKGTAYNNFLMDMYQKLPVINALFYMDKEQVLHKFSEQNEYSELIKNYRYVGYNNALDKKDKLVKYYYLP